jgi:hypothetical protein
MKRTFLTVTITAGILGLLRFTGCQASGVGDPCVPESEGADQSPNPNYFSATEPSVESKSFQCQTRVCLVNHFQGRVSCPYGQASTGVGPVGSENQPCANLAPTDPAYCGPCKIVGTTTDVPGPVPAECVDRTANQAVYCSCRCSDENGQTNNGENFCSCPDGFVCQNNLIDQVTTTDTGLAGGFCVKKGTEYVAGTSCVTAGTCTPGMNQPGCTQ